MENGAYGAGCFKGKFRTMLTILCIIYCLFVDQLLKMSKPYTVPGADV
jgi:hypothetical protein